MRILLLGLVVLAAFALPAAAATPSTKLTITTQLEGGRRGPVYTMTCGPAAVRGLPAGVLRPLDACRALVLVGRRVYQPRLSTHIAGCAYITSPRRATIAGYRLGRKVHTVVEVGACERLLVARRTLDRFVVWSGSSTR